MALFKGQKCRKLEKSPKIVKSMLSDFKIRFDRPKRRTDGRDTALRRFVDFAKITVFTGDQAGIRWTNHDFFQNPRIFAMLYLDHLFVFLGDRNGF